MAATLAKRRRAGGTRRPAESWGGTANRFDVDAGLDERHRDRERIELRVLRVVLRVFERVLHV